MLRAQTCPGFKRGPSFDKSCRQNKNGHDVSNPDSANQYYICSKIKSVNEEALCCSKISTAADDCQATADVTLRPVWPQGAATHRSKLGDILRVDPKSGSNHGALTQAQPPVQQRSLFLSGNHMAFTTADKAKVVAQFQRDAKDTGSSEVQIALLTNRINDLTTHFKEHSKDHHSRRGLLKMVSRRRKLLDYIKSTTPATYKSLIEKLGLRK